MRGRLSARVSAILGLLLAASPVLADGGVTTDVGGREAYSQPITALAAGRRAMVRDGRALFRQAWLVAPSADQPELDGLGPLHNRLSCIGCHVKNGRGEPPEGAGDVMRSTLLRLSVPDPARPGATLPHPVYGDQLNPDGIPGVPGEGQATLLWHEETVVLAGRETVRLRRPELRLSGLAYGELGPEVLYSVRMAPPVFGLGLLEAVPEEEMLALAAVNGGRPNRVTDTATGRMVTGRFGLKANQPGLRQQNAAAFAGDLGLTSALFPDESCTPTQTACRAACRAASAPPRPELADSQLDAVTLYVQTLAVPEPRNASDLAVRSGALLFRGIGCATCHTPTLRTGGHPVAELNGRTIHPYTDLLLHDMGEGLADGRPDLAATGREWRTPPLWGIGLAEAIGGRAAFLHDGRARSLTEAILWHGGQADAARNAFRALPPALRADLLAFLSSL